MSEKKRDKKGRILREGERQRKDGRYEYRYKDTDGEFVSIYSWRLVDADPTPSGKKACEPLRVLEKNIQYDIHDNINTRKSSVLTLNDAFDQYISLKPKIRQSTELAYKSLYDLHVRNGIGLKSVSKIKASEIKKLYISLQEENGLGIGTIRNIQTLLHPTFDMLVFDDVIRKNPTDGIMKDIEINSPKKKFALTIAEQERFLFFIRNQYRYKCYQPIITFLFGTGARIGEAAALQWKHVDFANKTVTIEQTLTKTRTEDGKEKFITGPPKSQTGNRVIPLFNDVLSMLESEYSRCVFSLGKKNIDNEYVFHAKLGELINPHSFAAVVYRLSEACNNNEVKKSARLGREPLIIRNFTPHIIRHTFCTRLCEQGVNPKVIQTIMGHSDISTTMDIYAEATEQFQRESIDAIDGRFVINAIGLP